MKHVTRFMRVVAYAALVAMCSPALADDQTDVKKTVDGVGQVADGAASDGRSKAADADIATGVTEALAERNKAKQKKVKRGGTVTKFGTLEGLDEDEIICRNEKKTGSRLVKQVCYRVGDILAYRKRLDEMGSLPGQRSAAGYSEGPGSDGL
ncbi:hypothetical protein GYB61_13080 [bacterium]|nr:hypothetical protein [bacterium]